MGESFLVFDVVYFKVTGVLADLPTNTGFRFEMLIPYKIAKADESWFYPSGNSSFGNHTYVELSPGVDIKTLSTSIRDMNLENGVFGLHGGF